VPTAIASLLLLASEPGCSIFNLGEGIGEGVGGAIGCGIGRGISATLMNLFSDAGVSIEQRSLEPVKLAMLFDRGGSATGGAPFPSISKTCAVKLETKGSSRLFDLTHCEGVGGYLLVQDTGADSYSLSLIGGILRPNVQFTGHIDLTNTMNGSVNVVVKGLVDRAGSTNQIPSMDVFDTLMLSFETEVSLDATWMLEPVASSTQKFLVSGQATDWHDHVWPEESGTGSAGAASTPYSPDPSTPDHNALVVNGFTLDTTCDNAGFGTIDGTVYNAQGASIGGFTYEQQAGSGRCGVCAHLDTTDTSPATLATGCGAATSSVDNCSL
jgi:hypothetical protein